MAFDQKTTALAFVGIIVLATIGVQMAPMSTRTVYTMVLPSMVLFGLVMLVLGIKHGEHRAGR